MWEVPLLLFSCNSWTHVICPWMKQHHILVIDLEHMPFSLHQYPHLIRCPPAGSVTEASIDYCFALKNHLLLGYGKTDESCGEWPIASLTSSIVTWITMDELSLQ